MSDSRPGNCVVCEKKPEAMDDQFVLSHTKTHDALRRRAVALCSPKCIAIHGMRMER